MGKLMVSIGDENFRLLSLEAKVRGISIQELIRAVIVPDWVRFSNLPRVQSEALRVQSVPRTRRESEIIPIYTR